MEEKKDVRRTAKRTVSGAGAGTEAGKKTAYGISFGESSRRPARTGTAGRSVPRTAANAEGNRASARPEAGRPNAGNAARPIREGTPRAGRQPGNAPAGNVPAGNAPVREGSRPVRGTGRRPDAVKNERDPRYDTSGDWKRADSVDTYSPPKFEGAPRVYAPRKKQPDAVRREDDGTMAGRLRAQAPARRREEKNRSRRVDVTEMKRRNRREEFRLKKEEESRRKLFFRRTAVVLVAYAIMMTVIGLFVGGNLIAAAAKNRDNVFIHISNKQDPRYVKRTQRMSSVFRDGVMYVSMTDIAMLGDLATTGDAGELRYLTSDGQTIAFAVGGETAYVNGVRVRLDRRTYTENGMFYVPASFIDRYVNGITITYDDSIQKMNIDRATVKNEYAETVDAPLSFTLVADRPAAGASQDQLDELLKSR